MLTGMALGASGYTPCTRKQKPPAYYVAVNEVSDLDRFVKEFAPVAEKTIKAHGGRALAVGKGIAMTGNLPQPARVAILAFDSMDQLSAWRHSPEYEAAQKMAEKYAKFNQVAVEAEMPQ